MAIRSQEYWNTLLEQYKEGKISDAERFELEKKALDDPFLFDALEGYAEWDRESSPQPIVNGNLETVSSTFTLPRLAFAASLILLLSVIFLMKQDANEDHEKTDQSIAMVLGDEDEATDEGKQTSGNSGFQEESKKSTQQESKLKNNEVADYEETNNSTNGTEENVVSTKKSKPTSPMSTEDKDKVMVPDNQRPIREEKVGSSKQDNKRSSSAANRSSEDITPIYNKKTSTMSTTADAADEIDLEKGIQEETIEIGNSVFYVVEPMIGKNDFDDYVQQRIDSRSLRQTPPQKVTIEFTIDKEGNLSEFIHIDPVCSECGPFAISILQNSGVWKTTPQRMEGRARYTFDF